MLSDQNVINNYIPQKFDTNPHSNELISEQSKKGLLFAYSDYTTRFVNPFRGLHSTSISIPLTR